MARLEQDIVPDVSESSDTASESKLRSKPPSVERLPSEARSKMTKSQRRNFLRRRKIVVGESGSAQPRSIPEAEKGGKRPRDTNAFTPEKGERKKPRTEVQNYSHVVKYHRVAITHGEYPEGSLTEELVERLKLKLLGLMKVNVPKDGEKRPICFSGFSWRPGYFIVNCLDERSRDWLIEAVGSITPFEEVPLRACDLRSLETFKRIAVFLPNPVEDVMGALENINAQNVGLDTRRWRVLPKGVKKQPAGMFLAISVPESQLRVMESQGNRFYHGFHVIEVWPLKHKDASGKQRGTEGEKDSTGTATEVRERTHARPAGASKRSCPAEAGGSGVSQTQLVSGRGIAAPCGSRTEVSQTTGVADKDGRLNRENREKPVRDPPPS